ncbi:uncharacterized protein LOC142767237 [Rhipicephalus microplus]|uniref:uncharacterized protein LOC142767237 n=1 Tax=Rhipicephalus microplus TaxID=6941 RepID=UPI003F6B3761
MASNGKDSTGKSTSITHQAELTERSQQKQPHPKDHQHKGHPKHHQHHNPQHRLDQPEQLEERHRQAPQQSHHGPQQQPQLRPEEQHQEQRQQKQEQQPPPKHAQQHSSQLQQEPREVQPRQLHKQLPRSCLKRASSEKHLTVTDALQSGHTTATSSMSQRDRKRSHPIGGTREGAATSVSAVTDDAGMKQQTKERKLDVCPVHNPPPVDVYYAGSGFPLCTCKKRPTWFDLFLGRSAVKKAESEDSKGFLHGDSCTSIEALQKANWAETSEVASKKLRGLFRRFHSTEDTSTQSDVLPSTA